MSGYFELWANQIAWKESPEDRKEMETLTTLIQSELKGQIHWAGSQSKSTAIQGSDLDMCVATSEPISEAQRRALAKQIAQQLGRSAQPRSHVIRVSPRTTGGAKLDVAFANAAFGSRSLPNKEEFKDPRRQHAARALKYWLRSGGMPPVGGWAIESLVVRLDNSEPLAFDLFLKIIKWLARPCSPNDIESLLKPRAQPCWNPTWSQKLPGRIEAIANKAKSLLNKQPPKFSSVEDVGAWLGASPTKK